MGTIINASIDVTKYNKNRLVKDKYLNITILVNDAVDDYGNNVAVIEKQTPEEITSKTKTYLGNGRVVYAEGQIKTYKELQAEKETVKKQETDNYGEYSDDLPF